MEILSCVAYLLIGFLTLWVSILLHFFYSQLSGSYNYPTETLGRKISDLSARVYPQFFYSYPHDEMGQLVVA